MDVPVIDQTKLESFFARAFGDLSAGYAGVMVSLGSKLGLYKAMAGAGPISSRELAARTGCAERYVREWLNAQAAGGYVGYHAVSEGHVRGGPGRGLSRQELRTHLFLRLLARPGRSGRRRPVRSRGPCSRRHGHAGRAVRQRPDRRQHFAGCAAVLRSFDHALLCACAFGGWSSRPRRAGGRGSPCRGIPQGGVHALSARGRDPL
jgi:Rv2258c-like winged HTH domain